MFNLQLPQLTMVDLGSQKKIFNSSFKNKVITNYRMYLKMKLKFNKTNNNKIKIEYKK